MADETITNVCGGCHAAELKSFDDSKHTKSLEGRRLATHCASCHGSMDMDVINVTRVVGRCRVCHGGDDDAMLQLAGDLLSRSIAIQGHEDHVRAVSDDQALLADIDASSERLADLWHRFDLDAVDVESSELIDKLRAEKRALSGER